MRVAAWLNAEWMWKCAGEASAFRRAARRPAECQAEVLAAILRRNRDTEFGQAHGFSRIVPKLQFGNETRAYQERVPLSSYEDYQESIQRIARGHHGILTADRVELLEPTSGTTRGEKLIPYTATLPRQFQRAVASWVYDLL